MGKNFCGVVAKSANMKLGENVFTTYRPVGVTCPSSCPFLNRGCYAQKYHTALSAQKAPVDSERFDSEMTAKTLRIVNGKKKKPSLIRFHTSGDVMLNDSVQHDYIDVLNKWADIFKNRIGVPVINYTHAWYMKGVEQLKTFTRASVHSVSDARTAVDNGWYTTVAVAKGKVKETVIELEAVGLKGVPCAYQTNKIKCADCKLCVASGSTKRVIIFEKH